MGVPGLSEGRAPGSGRPLDAGRTLDAGRQPGRTAFAGTYSPSKVARNFPRSVFDVPRKRWNCNDPISKFERRVGELRATFVGNHAGDCGSRRVCGCVVCRGRRGACRAWPGFEIDHSEPKARVWRSRGRAGPARASGVGEVGLRPAGQAAGRAGPASVGTRGLARSREAATPRSASRSRARTAPGRFPASRAR